MVKYTDANGNTKPLNKKEFSALMRTLWEIAQENKKQSKEVES